MATFFVLFFAMYVISGFLLRQLQTHTAGTGVGAALAYIH